MEIERGSTRSDSVENSLWEKLFMCRKTDVQVNDRHKSPSLGFESQCCRTDYMIRGLVKTLTFLRSIFFCNGATTQTGPSPPILRLLDHTQLDTHTHPVELLWLSDELVAVSATYTTQHSQETDIYVSGGIWTRNPSKRAAAVPRLRLLGHWINLKFTARAFVLCDALD
jgi:hypothetical protein